MSETEGSDGEVQERRRRIIERAYNPQPVRNFLDLYPNATQCYAEIRDMIKKHEIFDCGKVKLNPKGRPDRILSAWKIAPPKAVHEVTGTQVVAYLGFPALREPDVDPRLLPDAEILGPRKAFLEIDKSTSNLKDVLRHMRPFGQQELPLVVVTTSDRRMQGIRKCTEGAGLDDVLFLASLPKLLGTGLIEDRYGAPLLFKNLLNKCSHL